MNIYRVLVGFRRDSGTNYGHPTDRGDLLIEAESEQAARDVAIEEFYSRAQSRGETVSHVHISSVTLLD